jgi:hypothetical protein
LPPRTGRCRSDCLCFQSLEFGRSRTDCTTENTGEMALAAQTSTQANLRQTGTSAAEQVFGMVCTEFCYVRQLPNRHRSFQICFHVRRGLHVGASVSRKRLRKVRPPAFVVKGRPFVAERVGTAYDAFGQCAEVRRSASPVGSRALVQARNL